MLFLFLIKKLPSENGADIVLSTSFCFPPLVQIKVEDTLAVCFLHASDVTRNIAASLAFQLFSLFN